MDELILILKSYNLLLQIYAFIIGSMFGSFLNVCIYRIPKQMSVIRPGSHCPKCKKPVRWFDNIPILSYVLLKGGCRHCKSKISYRYPLIELLCGLLTLAVVVKYGFSASSFIYFVLIQSLVLITFIDLDHWIIPDIITYPGMIVGLVLSFINPDVTLMSSFLGLLVGGGLFFLFSWGFSAALGKEALGGGDVKLMGMLGAFLGVKSLLFIIFASAFQGTIAGIALILLNKEHPTPENNENEQQENLNDEPSWTPPPKAIPYGPFIALAAIEFIFWGNYIFDLYIEYFFSLN